MATPAIRSGRSAVANTVDSLVEKSLEGMGIRVM